MILYTMPKQCFTKTRENDTAKGKKGTKYQGCAGAKPKKKIKFKVKAKAEEPKAEEKPKKKIMKMSKATIEKNKKIKKQRADAEKVKSRIHPAVLKYTKTKLKDTPKSAPKKSMTAQLKEGKAKLKATPKPKPKPKAVAKAKPKSARDFLDTLKADKTKIMTAKDFEAEATASAKPYIDTLPRGMPTDSSAIDKGVSAKSAFAILRANGDVPKKRAKPRGKARETFTYGVDAETLYGRDRLMKGNYTRPGIKDYPPFAGKQSRDTTYHFNPKTQHFYEDAVGGRPIGKFDGTTATFKGPMGLVLKKHSSGMMIDSEYQKDWWKDPKARGRHYGQMSQSTGAREEDYHYNRF